MHLQLGMTLMQSQASLRSCKNDTVKFVDLEKECLFRRFTILMKQYTYIYG
ncbi:hypothetical protein HanRHA438_Chr17g0819821 [Helianthus annuus]|nr:hypothetical protein HanIR_Chr17g0878831 [Helianthus annuus]KAJ0813741.1 hypothetical protein HanPSC8_Chr17g0777081 [Helianthus annuus]KAJ0826925.1 hypothetical protein HanRHA438_Chr17g0819821 [Helianthus annuus]